MRTCLLILSLATFASCGKKTNKIDSYRANSFIAEQALVIPHGENGSIIRPKLLNKIVENSFPGTEEKSNKIIQIHDELQNVELSEGEVKDYEIKEKILTKVVVSFSDREEVYFVKERTPARDLILILQLKPESDRKLKLVSSPFEQSFPGATFYIVSANHEDLMKNDQQFFSVESAMDNLQEKFNIGTYKTALIKVNYDFQVQSLVPVVYTAPKVRCSRENIEDGACGNGCSFTTNLPSKKFEKMIPAKLEDLGLMIQNADALVEFDQLTVLNSKEGYFEIKIDSAEIKVLTKSSVIYFSASAHYNFSHACHQEDRAKMTSYSRSTQVSMSLKLNVFGRGEELKKIAL